MLLHLALKILDHEAYASINLFFIYIALGAFVLNHLTRALPLPASLKPAPFDSRLWPPLVSPRILGTPSVRELWGGPRWHQALRRTLIVSGYQPAFRIVRPLFGLTLAKAAGILAAFFVSGLFHEFGSRDLTSLED